MKHNQPMHLVKSTGLSPSLVQYSIVSILVKLLKCKLLCQYKNPTTPLYLYIGFWLVPLRSPLLRESRLLSFPPVNKMFQFTGLSILYL